jgi:acyl-CoA synthetase (AMP-forming)/AMP-acid ligase II
MAPDALLRQPFGTLSDVVRAHAAATPDRPALLFEERAVGFGELDGLADRAAAALQREGIAPGNAIGLCAINSVEWVAAFLGVLRAGAVAVPLAPAWTGESISRMLADARARLLFVDHEAGEALGPVRERIGAPWISLDGRGPGAPLETWLAPPGAPPRPAEVGPSDPFNLIYTSGTTGTPKGIVQPHAMRWAHVQRGPLLGYGLDAVTMVSLPLWSNTTLVSFLPALGMGGTVVLMRRFDAARFLSLAERHRATHAMLVPVLFQRLLAAPEFDRHDLSSFRVKTCTSAPFAAALKAEVLRRWPGGLVEFYGMSEGGASCMLPAHLHPDKLHTVGRPQPGHEIRLVDEAGRELAPGEIGEVVGRSPMMMTGYHGLPDATAAAEWFDTQRRRFIRTGDVGRLDEDGFLVLLDRKKDVVISGGANVYPSDLEAVLREHPAVAEAAVVGVPSERWGEAPMAFVVPAAGATATAEALRAWTNARLGKTQRLALVEIVEALPRSGVGKVLKRELRDRFLRRGGALP